MFRATGTERRQRDRDSDGLNARSEKHARTLVRSLHPLKRVAKRNTTRMLRRERWISILSFVYADSTARKPENKLAWGVTNDNHRSYKSNVFRFVLCIDFILVTVV